MPTTSMRTLTAALAALFNASAGPSTLARYNQYAIIADSLTDDERCDLIAVITEGAMHGPDAARAMADVITR